MVAHLGNISWCCDNASRMCSPVEMCSLAAVMFRGVVVVGILHVTVEWQSDHFIICGVVWGFWCSATVFARVKRICVCYLTPLRSCLACVVWSGHERGRSCDMVCRMLGGGLGRGRWL